MGWFWEIRNAVGGSGFGANPISFTEIKSWCDLNEIILSPWELYIIKRLDLEFLRISNSNTKDRLNNNKKR